MLSCVQMAGLISAGALTCGLGLAFGVVFHRRRLAVRLKSETLYRQLVESAGEGIAVCVGDRFVFANARMSRISGRSHEMLIARPIVENVCPDDRDAVAERFARRTRGEAVPSEYEFRIVNQRGSVVWIRGSSVLIDWEGRPATLDFYADVSGPKQAEMDLRKAKDEAEKADRVKSQFLSNMSHEIRTPLNGILGMSRLLEKGPLNDRQQRVLQLLKASGELLLHIVNDILDFSRIEAGVLTLNEVTLDVCRLTEDIVNSARIGAQNKGLELVLTIDPAVPLRLLGDPRAISQILINLLNNAIKFTHHGTIHLSVTKTHPTPEGVNLEFAVRDTGIGIPPDKRLVIFERFVQLDSSYAKAYAGTGLGLSIVKGFVDLLGGTVAVESEEGKGSIFTVRLPFRNAPQDDPVSLSSPTPSSPAFSGKRILAAEDNMINLLYLVEHLRNLGYAVVSAVNGKEVLALLEKQPFDLILLDIQMPEMDGLECVQRIRSAAGTRYCKIPVIALTGYAMDKDLQLFHDVGIDDMVPKPINERVLDDKITSILNRVPLDPHSTC